MAGIPFNSFWVGVNPSNLNRFFPNLVTLTDILQANGYRQRFIFGSDKGFASRGEFLESHGDVEVHDLNWYKNQNMLPMLYHEFWGFEDKKLYEYAKVELQQLAASEQPFFLGMLTVDTHTPEGYMCSECIREYGDSQIKNVIKCADRQAADFVSWLEGQPFFDNTTVVILGDHLFMETASSNLFGKAAIGGHATGGGADADLNESRRWLNIFINSMKEPAHQYNRQFSSFDMFPSILEAMGVEVPAGKLGFGRSLFNEEPTLIEQYGADVVNRRVMEKSIQYMELFHE